MPHISSSRRVVPTGATALVSHAYPPYIQSITPSISDTRSSPSRPKSAARTLVSWVTVKTKTRSKNSSSVVTRWAGGGVTGGAVAGGELMQHSA
jgi:hypothetical protein